MTDPLLDRAIRDELSARLEVDPTAIHWDKPPVDGGGCTQFLPVLAAFSTGLLLGWLLRFG